MSTFETTHHDRAVGGDAIERDGRALLGAVGVATVLALRDLVVQAAHHVF
jgi:hypothetical protein